MERIRKESDKFFLSLGYRHLGNGKYKVENSNDKRIALFAHQAFGLAFLSVLLSIPYPQFSTHFDMCHSGITAIEFKEENGYAYPRVLTLSNDSHLIKNNIPTNYNNSILF
jgi:broad specificity phosphatase PhoE